MRAAYKPKPFGGRRARGRDTESYYKNALRDKNCSFLVAEVDGQIAGFIRADIQRAAGFSRDNKILYINDLYVVKAFRRQGIAQALVTEAEKIAKAKHIKRVQTKLYTFNKPMRDLLRSMGYTVPIHCRRELPGPQGLVKFQVTAGRDCEVPLGMVFFKEILRSG
jgi:ribosomal protein S18 acetylase RimI-like enzyme